MSKPYQVRAQDHSFISDHVSLRAAILSILKDRLTDSCVIHAEVWDCVRPNHPRVVAVIDSGGELDLPVPI